MSERAAQRRTKGPFSMFMREVQALSPVDRSLTRVERSQRLQANVLSLRDTTLPQETRDRLTEEVYGAGLRIAVVTILKIAKQVGFDGYELSALISPSYDTLNGCIKNYDPTKTDANGKTTTFTNYLITSLRLRLNGEISSAREATKYPFALTRHRNTAIQQQLRAQEASLGEATSEGYRVARRVPLEEARDVIDNGADPEAAVLLMEFNETIVEQIIAALREKSKGRPGNPANRDIDALLLRNLLEGKTQSELAKTLGITDAAISFRYRRLIESDLPGLADTLREIADMDLGQG